MQSSQMYVIKRNGEKEKVMFDKITLRISKLIDEMARQESSRVKGKGGKKKETNVVINRINLLLESKELDKDVEKGIQNLLDKINHSTDPWEDINLFKFIKTGHHENNIEVRKIGTSY